MSLRPFKYLLTPVALEEGEDGRLRERPAQPIAVYSEQEAIDAIKRFEMEIAAIGEEPGVRPS